MPAVAPVSPAALEAAQRRIADARLVVVKIGSSVLVGEGGREIDRSVFVERVAELAALEDAGQQPILVTSGAVAVGRRALGVRPSPDETLARKQALAAVGQPRLMHLYAEEFAFHEKRVSQTLLTRDGLADRRRFLNARTTFRELGGIPGMIPIVNENDTVATEEIRFGDNDQLAALVCHAVGADALIILSDIDGLYDADPSVTPDARRIRHVWSDDPAITEMAGPAATAFGRGGMASKVRAAHAACAHGVPTVIAPGRRANVLADVMAGADLGTLFIPRENSLSSRKAWIGFASTPLGHLEVDDGAAAAIRERGRSLLPGGLTAIRGQFAAGDCVEILDGRGVPVGRGLVAYDAADLQRIAGRGSREIHDLLGFHNGDAVVHRDDLVLIDDPARSA